MFTSPPAVSKLLRDVRVEERRRHEKKFHLKARYARANVVTAYEVDMTAQIQTLQQQVNHHKLQLQTQSALTSPGATGVSMSSAGRGNGDDHRQGQQSGEDKGNQMAEDLVPLEEAQDVDFVFTVAKKGIIMQRAVHRRIPSWGNKSCWQVLNDLLQRCWKTYRNL